MYSRIDIETCASTTCSGFCCFGEVSTISHIMILQSSKQDYCTILYIGLLAICTAHSCLDVNFWQMTSSDQYSMYCCFGTVVWQVLCAIISHSPLCRLCSPSPSLFFAKTKLHKQCFSLGKPKRSITRPMSAEQAGYSLSSLSNKFIPVMQSLA